MFIDVSQKIEHGAVFRLGTPPVDISSKAFFHESEGEYETTILSLAAHTGTHIDLVYRTKRLPLDRMMGKGKLVDVTQISGREIQVADIQHQVRVEKGDFLFFRTGWSERLGTDQYYLHPELSQELVTWLASRQINMVGIDALGLGRGPKHGQHDRYLAERDIFVIENLANLSAIPVPEFRVYCFPLKIGEIDAIPARVLVEVEMKGHDSLPATVMDALRSRLGSRIEEYSIPPPVFRAMQAEFLAFDLDGESLTARFPVLESYLNPYGTMQGGMVAAAVDNTLGPLSMLVAPPNVTRRLEMTYGRPVAPDLESIVVTARLLERRDRWLFFGADVRSQEGARLARAKAMHWVLDEVGSSL